MDGLGKTATGRQIDTPATGRLWIGADSVILQCERPGTAIATDPAWPPQFGEGHRLTETRQVDAGCHNGKS